MSGKDRVMQRRPLAWPGIDARTALDAAVLRRGLALARRVNLLALALGALALFGTGRLHG